MAEQMQKLVPKKFKWIIIQSYIYKYNSLKIQSYHQITNHSSRELIKNNHKKCQTNSHGSYTF